MSEANNYKWTYASIGGVVRVKIDSGEAIAHLDELDQKKWTVLSCPVAGLEFDPFTLGVLDADKDGKIRVNEVVDASKWLTGVIKDNDLLLQGLDELPLDQIDDSTEEGAQLKKSAMQIISNLGKDKDSISVADTSDSAAIFAGTKFNGDGVIIPASADDDALGAIIKAAMDKFGAVKDISGEDGADEAKIQAFYTAAADFSAWKAAGEADRDNIFPYGDNTEAALAACETLKDKVADYFMRCKLIGFDEKLAAAVDVSADKVAAISAGNLDACKAEIAECPLARPAKEAVLAFDGINPAWKDAFASLKALVLDVDFKDAASITEDQWNATIAKFAAYSAWKAAKKGAEVEDLGLDYINGILNDGSKDKILALIEQDKALKPELDGVCNVNKLTHLFKNFYKFLKNYIVFADFYHPESDDKAVFNAGELYIDERCCHLCIKVENMGAHADMAALSGMFLLYCTCTSKTLGKTMDIVAVMTDGNTKNLRAGKNAIFYDRAGNDWDAVVTKVVDNPINVRQAFFAPYRKFVNFISEKINKSASDKESAAVANLQASADNVNVAAPDSAKKQAFDIAKFAGIFAAIGMAIGFIGDALVSLATGISSHPWWQTALAIIGIMLVISGPSCFIAWSKLRKRNLGPVLNANGWAINSLVKVNVPFGKTLTSVAKYPVIKGGDPFEEKSSPLKKTIIGIIIAAAVALGVMWLMGTFDKEEAVEDNVETVEVAGEVPAANPNDAIVGDN